MSDPDQEEPFSVATMKMEEFDLLGLDVKPFELTWLLEKSAYYLPVSSL